MIFHLGWEPPGKNISIQKAVSLYHLAKCNCLGDKVKKKFIHVNRWSNKLSEPLTKSNNSPINLTPGKKKSQKVSPPPPTRSELPPFGPLFHLEFRCPPWGGYGYFLEPHNFTLFFDPKQSLAELDFRFTLPPGGALPCLGYTGMCC